LLRFDRTVDNNIRVWDRNPSQPAHQWTHGPDIFACAIYPDARSVPQISCVYVDKTGLIIRVKPPTGFLGRTSPRPEFHELAQDSKGVDTIIWKGGIVAWASDRYFKVMRITKGTMEKPLTVTPESMYDSPYPRFSFLVHSPDSLTVDFGGLLYEIVLGAKGHVGEPEKTQAQLIAKNGDLIAKLVFPDSRDRTADVQPRIEVAAGDDAYGMDLPLRYFEPRKFVALAPAKTDFVLALTLGVYAITRLTSTSLRSGTSRCASRGSASSERRSR
jgi:hypothetical protein